MIGSVDDFIKEIIKNNDQKSMLAFYTHMYPSLPDGNKSRLENHFLLEALFSVSSDDKSEEILRIMVEAVGFNEFTSSTYLSRVMEEGHLNYSFFVDEAIAALGAGHERSFATAVLSGHLDIANKIIDTYGEIDLSSPGKINRINDNEFEINGKNCGAFLLDFNLKDNNHFEECIRLAQKSGMSSLIDYREGGGFFREGGGFFNRSRFIRSRESLLNMSEINIELPKLVNGIVHNPELLIILNEKISSDSFTDKREDSDDFIRDEDKALSSTPNKRVSGRIVCWIDRKHLGEIKSARQYIPRKGMITTHKDGRISHCDYGDMESESTLAEFKNNESRSRIEMTIIPLETSYNYPEYYDSVRIDHFLGMPHKSGFFHGDLVLCVVNTDELAQFEVGNIDGERASNVSNHLNTMNLPAMLSLLSSDPFEQESNGVTYNKAYPLGLSRDPYSNDKSLSDHLSQDFIKIISKSKETMDEAIQKIGLAAITRWISIGTYSMADYANIYKNSGLSTEDFMIKILNEDQLKDLSNYGFKFGERSRMLKHLESGSPSHGINLMCQMTQMVAKHFCDMGFWPGSKDRPKSIRKLVELISEHDNPVYEGYALHLGIEEVTKECSADSEWSAVLSVFPESERDKVINSMPSKSKRKHVESSLGL